jgi:thiamine biosynthesis lipoprotein
MKTTTKANSVAERRAPAMGTEAHIQVLAGPDCGDPQWLADDLLARVEELEQKWSRFSTESEVTALNRAQGSEVKLSQDTILLVERAVAAWRRTGGSFDPTVLAAVIANGYDRDFVTIGPLPRISGVASPAPGCAGIEIEPDAGLVTLPVGVGFDPGGLGKGLAADIVTEQAMRAGAIGAMVNLGGDMTLRGRCADGHQGWLVSVVEPSADVDLTLSLSGGAIASSTNQRRRWTAGGVRRHHLIDPASGSCTSADPLLVTAVASEGWWAEATTKHVYVSWSRSSSTELDDFARRNEVSILVIDGGGRIHTYGGMEAYIR